MKRVIIDRKEMYYSDTKRLREDISEEKESKSKSFYYSKTGMLYHGINSINNLDENKFENHFIVCGFIIIKKKLN